VVGVFWLYEDLKDPRPAADSLSRDFQGRCAASINLLRARRER